jgi:hypothetical protein
VKTKSAIQEECSQQSCQATRGRNLASMRFTLATGTWWKLAKALSHNGEHSPWLPYSDRKVWLELAHKITCAVRRARAIGPYRCQTWEAFCADTNSVHVFLADWQVRAIEGFLATQHVSQLETLKDMDFVRATFLETKRAVMTPL